MTPTAVTAPDDHFTAGPDCCVAASGSRGIGECRWSPRVIGAATRGISYYRKLVGAVHLNRRWRLSQVAATFFGICVSAVRSDLNCAQLCVVCAPTNRRSNALLILVWPNTPR